MAKKLRPAGALDALARNVSETTAGIVDTVRTVGETMSAAGAVIGHRTAMGAQAVVDPLNADHAEFHLMTSEKVAAFSRAGAALASEMNGLNHEVMGFFAQQTAGAAQALFAFGAAATPQAMMAVQQRFLMESWARGSAHAMKLAALGSAASAQVLAPVHRTATANARRLAKKTHG